MKPHKGSIVNWFKHTFDKEKAAAEYGEDVGLGYLIRGHFVDHPQFGNSPNGHTSWVVKKRKLKKSHPQQDERWEIETRNSRYTLVGKPLK